MTAFPETIPGLVARLVTRTPDRPWLFYEGDSWSGADVVDRVERIATGLAERGVKHGDRVAVVLGNRPETLFTWFAANRLGAIFVPLNHALKKPEIAGALKLTRPGLVVVSEHRELVASALDELPATHRPLLASPEELASAGRGAPATEVGRDDVAVLLNTSGTTGAPKAVAQTHGTYALTAEAFPYWLGLTESDRLLAALPFFHVNAQAYSTMGALGAGASLAILPKFSAQNFWSDARRLGATQFNGVGAMIHILLRTEPRPSDREHFVRICYAALALPEREHRRFEERFGTTLTVGYGMSETTFGTVWPRGEPRRYGTMGTLRQHPRLGEINHARVVRDDGRDARADEPGELWLQNPGTMRGYWNDAAATELALVDGWLHTGDLVRRDADGFFTFVARKKDVIRRRGENVAAAEIENVLVAHPSVLEAAAIGVPSDLGEDEIVAFVVAKEGKIVDPEALRQWAREHLADFKVPKDVHVLDALPRTETARVAKHLLKDHPRRAPASVERDRGPSFVRYPQGHVLLRNLGKDLPIVSHGDGIYLFDRDGKRYVDASSGALVASVGHGNRAIADAVHAQLLQVGYVNGTQFTSDATEALADRLATWVERELPEFGRARSAFLCSGSETVEAAVKFARQLWIERGEPSRSKIIARVPSYHGNTLYALSASGRPHYRTIYGPLLSSVLTTPAPYPYRSGLADYAKEGADHYLRQLQELVEKEDPRTIAAFVVEPIIGSSAGAAVPPPGYFERVRSFCDRHGILVIADEVLCGSGRCGAFFASHLTSLTPDVIVLGKGLGGGYAPLSALIVKQAHLEEMRRGTGYFQHAQTYLQAPFITAAGLAVLDYFERNGVVEHAARHGERLQAKLSENLAPLDLVGCVQGRGLLAGIELVADTSTRAPYPRARKVAERLTAHLFERGIIVWPNVGQADGVDGDLLMIGPPLVIEEPQIDDLAEALRRAIEEFEP